MPRRAGPEASAVEEPLRREWLDGWARGVAYARRRVAYARRRVAQAAASARSAAAAGAPGPAGGRGRRQGHAAAHPKERPG